MTDLTVLNQLDAGVSQRIESGTGVRTITIPQGRPIPDDLRGDVLLVPRRSPDWARLIERGVRWVHIAGAGAEGIPSHLLQEVLVTCSRGAYAVPMAEYAMAAILAAEKSVPNVWVSAQPPGPWGDLGRLEDEADIFDAIRPWDAIPDRWGFVPTGTLKGRVLGIVGFGAVGREIAVRALAFGMSVLGVRRTSKPSEVPGVEIVSFDEALTRSDHLVVAAAATRSTDHLMNAAAFAAMKRGSHFVNVARGSLVDHAALIRAVDLGSPGLATLDVADPEPLPTGHPLYHHPRVRLSPHVSWCSPTRQRAVADIFIEELKRYVAGQPLQNVVNLAEGY